MLASPTSGPHTPSQWINYAGRDGFAIGLSTLTPLTHENELGEQVAGDAPMLPGWRDVVYEPDEQMRLAQETLDGILSRFSSSWKPGTPVDGAANLERIALNTLAACFKQPRFATERETRRLSVLKDGHSPHLRDSVRGSVPYVVLASTDDDAYPLVEEVRLGPDVDDATMRLAKTLMRESGLDSVTISRSQVRGVASP